MKARRFVLTLHDHFRENYRSKEMSSEDDDSWALQFIHVHWLHAIMEAIDVDYSGYVTIAELNKFIIDLPPSLNWR